MKIKNPIITIEVTKTDSNSPTKISCSVANIDKKFEYTPPHSSWDDDDAYDRSEFRPDSSVYR